MTDLHLEHAFDLWDWTTVIGLVAVGIIFGFVLLPYLWHEPLSRTFPAVMAGMLAATLFATFFAFLLAFRYLTIDPVTTAKTIGTSLEGIVFATATGLGLGLRNPRPASPNIEDIAASLENIRRMVVAAGLNAESARIAASAADDRVISQGERSVDERARGARLEDALGENTDLTRLAVEHADHAYREANSVNQKIATQGAVIVAQGEAAVTDRKRVARIEDVGIDTNERAIDIQDRLS